MTVLVLSDNDSVEPIVLVVKAEDELVSCYSFTSNVLAVYKL